MTERNHLRPLLHERWQSKSTNCYCSMLDCSVNSVSLNTGRVCSSIDMPDDCPRHKTTSILHEKPVFNQYFITSVDPLMSLIGVHCRICGAKETTTYCTLCLERRLRVQNSTVQLEECQHWWQQSFYRHATYYFSCFFRLHSIQYLHLLLELAPVVLLMSWSSLKFAFRSSCKNEFDSFFKGHFPSFLSLLMNAHNHSKPYLFWNMLHFLFL